MKFIKESAPHIRRKDSAWIMMFDVIIALLPTLIFAIVVFPLKTLLTLLISSVIMLLAEFIAIGLTKMMPKDGLKHSFKERFIYSYKGRFQKVNVFSPLVSALIFTLITPSGASLYSIAIGALIGIVFAKLVFGGLGNNIFNPAAVGMLFAKFAFGSSYNTYLSLPSWFSGEVATSVGGTALSEVSSSGYYLINDYNLLDLFLGKSQGTLGEVYTITILIGLIYLMIRRTIDFRIVVSYFATFILLILVAGICIASKISNLNIFKFVGFELLTGGVLFGGVFMITDPVTSPLTKPSRIIYGIIAGIVTVFVRLFGSLPEGVGISILVANMFTPILDYNKWSNISYTKKNVLVMGILLVISILIIVLSLLFGGLINE